MNEDIKELTTIVKAMAKDLSDVKETVGVMQGDIGIMQKDIGNLKVENEKISKKLKYIDRKFSDKIKKVDSKFTAITGKINIKLSDMQEDIKYLKLQPYYANSRLSFLEGQQEITDKRLKILESKYA